MLLWNENPPDRLPAPSPTPADRALSEDLAALVEARLATLVEHDGELRIGVAEPAPLRLAPRCVAAPGGRPLAPLADLPVPVRAALVDRPDPFVVARANAEGICPVAGPVLCRALERVLGLPVVVATPRAAGGWLLYGSPPHLPAAAGLRFGELAWVDLDPEA